MKFLVKENWGNRKFFGFKSLKFFDEKQKIISYENIDVSIPWKSKQISEE